MGDKFKTSHEQQLAHEVDERRVDGESVHIRIEIPFPQKIGERSGEKERRYNLQIDA